MKIHTGDIVRIIAGKNRFRTEKTKEGKEQRIPVEAKVLRVFPKDNRVLVEGVNIITRHIKKQGNTPGRKIQIEKPVHISNVMLVCPLTKKPTRIRIQRDGNKTTRISVKSGKSLS